ncbi:MAG: YqgE/AlgH family protein [Bryobacteraceae bacterium]
MSRLVIAGMVLSIYACAQVASAQSTRPEDLAAGKLLVASPDLPDPNFAQTVVLLVEYDDDGVVGLILNRRSKVPISRVLEELAGAKNRADPVYAGGPVGRTDVMALVRGRRAPGGAKRVVGDVFLVSSKEDMEKTFAGATDADTVHVYLGYSGWTMAQLQHELDLGAWYIFAGNAKAVFEQDPDALWQRLIRETELRIAFNRRAADAGWAPRE